MAEITSERGLHPNQIYRWKELALHGQPSLFNDEAQAAKAAAAEHEKQLAELYAEIGRLTTQLRWLEKNLASTLSRAERVACLTAQRLPTRTEHACDERDSLKSNPELVSSRMGSLQSNLEGTTMRNHARS